MYFRIMAAISDLPVTLTSEIIDISPVVVLDLENVGLSFESCCYQVYKRRYRYCICTSG